MVLLHRHHAVLLVVSAALTGACGPDEISLEELPRSYSDAVCDWAINCGEFEEGDLDFCAKTIGVEAYITSWVLTADVRRAIETGSVSYDAEAALECVEAFRGSSCVESSLDSIFAGAACEGVFSGSIEIGSLCWTDLQCQSQFCDTDYWACDQACCAGTCAALPNAVLGQPCPGGFCVDASICDYETETCVPKQWVGGACVDSYECSAGLACLGHTDRACANPRNSGEGCVGGECGRMGLICDSTIDRCVEVQRAGDICNPDVDLCGWGLSCNPGTNTCQIVGGIGAKCRDDYDCGDWTLYCDGDYSLEGTCRQSKADGAACVDNWECQGSSCVAGMCAPEVACVP
jgi:hypothetical protein